MPLSRRERQIVSLWAEGLTRVEIARRLGISPHTVKNFASRVLVKLDVHNRTQAVIAAWRAGWVR